jgi:pantothenate kinase
VFRIDITVKSFQNYYTSRYLASLMNAKADTGDGDTTGQPNLDEETDKISRQLMKNRTR